MFPKGRLLMIFSLSLEGQVREWYLSLLQACIEYFDDFEYLFMKRWSCNAQGTFNQITRGREDIWEFIQKFDRVVKDIHDHLKPLDANILKKFIKFMGVHLNYALRDKKPSTLVEAKEIAMDHPRANDHPTSKVEIKKEKSKINNKKPF